jgi:hypothetical protein
MYPFLSSYLGTQPATMAAAGEVKEGGSLSGPIRPSRRMRVLGVLYLLLRRWIPIPCLRTSPSHQPRNSSRPWLRLERATR